MTFAEKYGPWALIMGASEGTGRAFARQLAAQGLPSVLVARRQQPLQALADEIRAEFGVDCIVASTDLSQPNAVDKIKQACGERHIGLLVCNAGADPNGAHFLDKTIDNWQQLTMLNVVTPLACVHYFASEMRVKKRGGILIVGSGACYGGGAYMATYTGVKAFQLCFTESLWAELKPHNVDVLHLVLTTTDTPAFHQLLEEKGKKPPKNLAAPEAVAATGLAKLSAGPIYNWGQRFGLRASWRKRRLMLISYFSEKMVFGQ